MDSQYQEFSAQILVARDGDGPKYYIDPVFILFCRESPPLFFVAIVFWSCFLAAFRARTLGQRNIPVLFQGGMVASNLTLIILLGRQWYSYHRAFLELDEEMPDQIHIGVRIALYLGIIFSSIILFVAVLIFIGLWIPKMFLFKSPIDEESRHSGPVTDRNPDHYNQPIRSGITQVALTCAWIITCLSMQAKLPGATYANMPGAYLFPPSRLELSLEGLAGIHIFLGLAGWALLSSVIIQFGKTVILFRLDVTTRFQSLWRMFKAEYQVELANERALRASREGTARATSWLSEDSSSSSNTPASSLNTPASSSETSESLDGIAAGIDRDTRLEMERTPSTSTLNESREERVRRLVVDRSSPETEDDSLDIPQSAKLRN